MSNQSRWFTRLLIVVPACAAAAAVTMSNIQLSPSTEPATESADPVRHPVQIRRPEGPPRIPTGLTDPLGAAITVNCTTCHATRPPNTQLVYGDQLQQFHTGLHTNHGELTCMSCHNGGDYRQLRMADGRPLPFSDVMQLCAQCHGPQHRDYQAGSHGGMTGYGDLSRGPRVRNNCIDCHDPHAPQFPMIQPVFAPNDRFLHGANVTREPGHE